MMFENFQIGHEEYFAGIFKREQLEKIDIEFASKFGQQGFRLKENNIVGIQVWGSPVNKYRFNLCPDKIDREALLMRAEDKFGKLTEGTAEELQEHLDYCRKYFSFR